MGISSEFLGTNSNPGGRSPNTRPEVLLANNSISSFFNLVTPEPKPSPYAVGDLIPYGAGFLKYVNIKKNEKNIWVLRLKDQNNKEYSVQIQKQDMPNEKAILDQLKNTSLKIPSSALFKAPAPQQTTQQATSQSSSAPKPGDTREADVDPDGAGPQKGTYVSVPSKDGRSFQTRLVKLQAFNGTKWVDQGYGVRDIIQVHNQKQRQLTKTSLDLVGVTDRSRAEEWARAWLSNSPQVTGKPRTVVAPQPVETFKTARLAITTGNVALSGPTQARGFIELLDQQVAPDAQRYLQAGNALIGLSGSDLQNFVGVAMDLAPNVAPVPGRGNQLLYQGEVLTPIGTVSAALRAAGGEAPRVRPVPVYLRVGDNQLAKTVIFRVQGRDGRERIVDNVGRTYDSLENWKQHNQLGAVEVFLPQGGQMTGRDGKVLLEAFNNRRFDNTALPVVRGGVAILGAAAGVAVMLGTGGVAAPLVMAGGAVFSVADSGVTLADRFQRGQTLNLTNQQARAAWLDFGAGLLGAGAIGSGLKWVARASDLADVLTVGNSATDLAIDWNKLSPGERALAGAQLAFWSAMLGASQFSGGRFNLDPLTKPGGGRGGDPNVKPTNSRTDPPPTKKQVEEQVTQQLSPQGIQQLSTKVFSSPDFQTRLVEALKGKEQLASNQAGLRNLAQKVALDTVVKRTFDDSGVPSNVQLNFRLLAEQWAKQQVKKDGGTTAGWLEALVTHNNSSAHRADMLRSSVAQHLGGGNKRLQNAVGAQLGELSEAQLKNLVAPGSGGAPQKAAVTILRDALVNRWAEDFKLSQKQKDQLGANLDQQLQNKKPNTQLEYLRKLDTNAKVRKSLVSDVQNPQGAENTAVTNPPTQNPPKTPKTVGSPNPNPNLNPNTSDITFPPQTIEDILKAISTAGGYEQAMTVLGNMADMGDIPLTTLTRIPGVKELLESLNTNQGTPSNQIKLNNEMGTNQVPPGRYGETLAGQSNTPQAPNPPVDLSQVPRNSFVPDDQLTLINITDWQDVTMPLEPGSLTAEDFKNGIDQLAREKRAGFVRKLVAGPVGVPGRLLRNVKDLNEPFSVIPETFIGNVHVDWQRLAALRLQLKDPAVKSAINEIGLMNLSEPDRPVNLREAGLEFPLPKSVSENLLNGKLPQNIRELYQLEIALQDPALSKAFSPNANSNVNPDAEELRKTSLFKTLTKDQLSRIPASILKYDQPQVVGLVGLTTSATEFAVDKVEGVKARVFNDVNKKIALGGAAVLSAQFVGDVLAGKVFDISGPNASQPAIVKNLNSTNEGQMIGITTTPDKPSNNYVAASGNLGLSVRKSTIDRFQFKSGGSANPAPQIRSNIVRIAELAVGFNFSVLDGELGVRGAVAVNLGGTQNPIYLSTGDTVAGKLPASAAIVAGGVGVVGYFGVVIGPYILAVRNPAGFGAIGAARSTVGVSGTPGAFNLGLGEAIYNNPSSKIDIGKLWRNFSEGAPFEIPVDIKDIQVVQNPTPEDFKSYQLELFKGGGWRYLEPQQAQEAVLREEFLIPLLEKYAQYGPEKFVSQFDDPNTRRFIKDNLEVFQKMSAVYSEGGVDALGISNDRP